MKLKFKKLGFDMSAGLVVFLVALPLCLGIGHASTDVEGVTGLPNVFSGIIAGIVGGIVIGFLSGSRYGVSGPAAGLLAIVVAAIASIGSYEGFLLSVCIAGIIQIIAGFLGLGIISHYFPSAVIKGMLAAIGITLILKEIPHALGYDKDFFGDESLVQPDGHNTFSELLYASGSLHAGAIFICLVSLGIIILFEQRFFKKKMVFTFLPSALIAVVAGVLVNALFVHFYPEIAVSGEHLVNMPVAQNIPDFFAMFSMPDLAYLNNPTVYGVGITMALVASIETILCAEATDKMDPDKHVTPTNRELKAQGVGNFISGLIGGLPLTQVVVRSSANMNAGAKSKASAIFHGVLLLISVIFIPKILNLIPLASLAAILLVVGYKLTKISIIRGMYKLGWDQFLPFVATIVAVILSDLLKGIGVGIAVAVFFILKRNYQNHFKKITEHNEDGLRFHIELSEVVTFLNKGGIASSLMKIPRKSHVIIDGSNCTSIDYDVLEVIQNFKLHIAKEKHIEVTVINVPEVESFNSH